MEDLKTSVDRIGDRQFKTTRKKVKLLIVLIITILSWSIFATVYQNYIMSFNKSKMQVVKNYQLINNIPQWKITFKNI